jgi:MoaA/NifB/PqqE/SkfB family radical SAM enzyme
MSSILSESSSICPFCGSDAPGVYITRRDGVYFILECPVHGVHEEKVENDIDSFIHRYEMDYAQGPKHLVFPLTYRCNMKCPYCYSLSNTPEGNRIADRNRSQIESILSGRTENIMFSGGEPTIRQDLPGLIQHAKSLLPDRRVSIATNGLKLANPSYAETLKESGLDFILFSLHDSGYEPEKIPGRKMQALENMGRYNIPVWLSRTIDNVRQIDSLLTILERFRKVIFHVTLRSAKPYGYFNPGKEIFISDILKYLGKERDHEKGRSPFNCYIRIAGRRVKVSSWVCDTGRLDPIDDDILIVDDRILPLHRGLRLDPILLPKYIKHTKKQT